jgi:nucleoside-diphosphate-sugar epimerase
VKDTILLTGATGALGSMLLRRLLDQGYEVVCLVRAKDPSEARVRIRAITGNRWEVKVIRGDIAEPQCGISDIDRQLLAGVKRVIHCAASINFQDKNEIQLTNVAGLRHVLELTDMLDARHIVHISTAYVVGDAPYLSEKSLFLGQRWNNPYEESKFIGEGMVHAWALQRKERRFTIFRPSILVGCEDGTTSTLDGYTRYIEPLYRVAKSLRNHNGKPPPSDVLIRGDGQIRVPLAVLMADKRINYVPIDWAADMMVAAIDLPPCNETLHFVHHDPLRLRDGFAWSLDYLKIDGVVICNTQNEKDIAIRAQTPFVRRLQRRIDAVHNVYAPYCTAEPQFEMEAALRGLGAKFRLPPTIDHNFLQRLFSYARLEFWDADK